MVLGTPRIIDLSQQKSKGSISTSERHKEREKLLQRKKKYKERLSHQKESDAKYKAYASGDEVYTIVKDTRVSTGVGSLLVDAFSVTARIINVRCDYFGTDLIGGTDSAELYFTIVAGGDGEYGTSGISRWAINHTTKELDVEKSGKYHDFAVNWPIFENKLVRWNLWIGATAWENDGGMSAIESQKFEDLSDDYLDILTEMNNNSGISPWNDDGEDYAKAGAALGHIIFGFISHMDDDEYGSEIIKIDRSSMEGNEKFIFEDEGYWGEDLTAFITWEITCKRVSLIPAESIYVPPSLLTGIYKNSNNYSDCSKALVEFLMSNEEQVKSLNLKGKAATAELIQELNHGLSHLKNKAKDGGYAFDWFTLASTLEQITDTMHRIVYKFTPEEWQFIKEGQNRNANQGNQQKYWPPDGWENIQAIIEFQEFLEDWGNNQEAYMTSRYAIFYYLWYRFISMAIKGVLFNKNAIAIIFALVTEIPDNTAPTDNKPPSGKTSVYGINYNNSYKLGGLVAYFGKLAKLWEEGL